MKVTLVFVVNDPSELEPLYEDYDICTQMGDGDYVAKYEHLRRIVNKATATLEGATNGRKTDS